MVVFFKVVFVIAVVKVAKSGKSLLFIDDSGNCFITSRVFLEGLLAGKSRSGFLLLKRLPNPVSSVRFMKSPVLEFGVDGSVVGEKVSSDGGVSSFVSTADDSFSVKSVKDKEQSRVYSRTVVIE